MADQNHPSHRFDNTVDSTPEASIQKAIALMDTTASDVRPMIVRPLFTPRRGLLKFSLTLLVFAIAFFILYFLSISPLWLLPFAIAVIILKARKAIIWLILLYQRYAPEKIRSACLYTPSCSAYMLMAIRKYGVLKGVWKGIGRLLRCRPPNGGIDNP